MRVGRQECDRLACPEVVGRKDPVGEFRVRDVDGVVEDADQDAPAGEAGRARRVHTHDHEVPKVRRGWECREDVRIRRQRELTARHTGPSPRRQPMTKLRFAGPFPYSNKIEREATVAHRR
jgi:hypothetical protein